MNHPVVLLLFTALAVYVGKLWADDRAAASKGVPKSHSLPGATEAPRKIILIAVIGGFLLVGLETFGENALGISAQQSHMTWLFAAYTVIAAPLVEEIIFRGWLVIERRGAAIMWAAVVGASVLFAVLHPFLWRWDEQGFAFTLEQKGWFSTGVVFATSIWLYSTRLGPWNPKRSLTPCFAGHAAKNFGVVLVKAATGYLQGLW